MPNNPMKFPIPASSAHSPDEEPQEVERSPTGRYIRYNVLLGRGACKRVYKALDTEDGLEVAWNQVDLDQWSPDDDARAHLFEEIRVLQQLKHKNIISFFAWWHDKEQNIINFITELFTAGNLRQYRRKLRLMNENVLKRWAHEILEGLLYLHGHVPPIVHRDLKCDNIFINSGTGEVKIGDLGLATVQQQGMSVVGTPEFMAPEVYDESYDERCDIYSFGMCMLELATLEYPYAECHSVPQIFKKVTLGIPPASLARVTSPELRDFIALCISHNPEDRPSARELLKHPYLQPVHNVDGVLLHSGGGSCSGGLAAMAGGSCHNSAWSTPKGTVHAAGSMRDLRDALHLQEALTRHLQQQNHQLGTLTQIDSSHVLHPSVPMPSPGTSPHPGTPVDGRSRPSPPSPLSIPASHPGRSPMILSPTAPVHRSPLGTRSTLSGPQVDQALLPPAVDSPLTTASALEEVLGVAAERAQPERAISDTVSAPSTAILTMTPGAQSGVTTVEPPQAPVCEEGVISRHGSAAEQPCSTAGYSEPDARKVRCCSRSSSRGSRSTPSSDTGSDPDADADSELEVVVPIELVRASLLNEGFVEPEEESATEAVHTTGHGHAAAGSSQNGDPPAPGRWYNDVTDRALSLEQIKSRGRFPSLGRTPSFTEAPSLVDGIRGAGTNAFADGPSTGMAEDAMEANEVTFRTLPVRCSNGDRTPALRMSFDGPVSRGAAAEEQQQQHRHGLLSTTSSPTYSPDRPTGATSPASATAGPVAPGGLPLPSFLNKVTMVTLAAASAGAVAADRVRQPLLLRATSARVASSSHPVYSEGSAHREANGMGGHKRNLSGEGFQLSGASAPLRGLLDASATSLQGVLPEGRPLESSPGNSDVHAFLSGREAATNTNPWSTADKAADGVQSSSCSAPLSPGDGTSGAVSRLMALFAAASEDFNASAPASTPAVEAGSPSAVHLSEAAVPADAASETVSERAPAAAGVSLERLPQTDELSTPTRLRVQLPVLQEDAAAERDSPHGRCSLAGSEGSRALEVTSPFAAGPSEVAFTSGVKQGTTAVSSEGPLTAAGMFLHDEERTDELYTPTRARMHLHVLPVLQEDAAAERDMPYVCCSSVGSDGSKDPAGDVMVVSEFARPIKGVIMRLRQWRRLAQEHLRARRS